MWIQLIGFQQIRQRLPFVYGKQVGLAGHQISLGKVRVVLGSLNEHLLGLFAGIEVVQFHTHLVHFFGNGKGVLAAGTETKAQNQPANK